MQGTTVPMNVETKEVTAYMNEAETRVRNGNVFPCPPTVSDLCDEVYNDIRRYLSRPKAVIRSSLDDNWGLVVPFVLDSAFFEQFLAGGSEVLWVFALPCVFDYKSPLPPI